MTKDSIGNRMKENYENRYRIKLTRRTPVIIRLDGKAFHTLTSKYKCDKPFDSDFQTAMQQTAKKLCNKIQGAKCAYVQSDEISILLTDFDKLTTDGWFDYNLQKIVSVSAGIASACFTVNYCIIDRGNTIGVFDSRVFNIPKEEVCNYFIWRQQDWLRNSIQMLAQSVYPHKELQNKNTNDLHEMLYLKNINWNDLDPACKNGTFISKPKNEEWEENYGIIFTKNREVIEQYMQPITEEYDV